PVSDVARITVTRGGASVLYGPNGLGGVINIVTFQAEEGLNTEANLRLADNSTFLAHGATGGKKGSFDWYLGAGLEQSDGFSLSEDFQTEPYQPQGLRLNSDLERFSIIGRVGMELSEADRFSVTLRWIDAEKGIPFHTTRPSGFVKFSRFPEWRQGTFTLGWQRDLTGEGSIRAQVFSHHFDNTLDVFSGPELEERLLRSTFADRVVGGFIVGDKRFGAHLLSGAIHLREDHHRRFEETEVSSMELVERFTALTGSAGAEGRLTLGKRSVMILGATLDHNAVTESWDFQTGEMNHTSETIFSPQGEVRTLFKGNLTGSLAVYRRTRFPTLRQLFGGDVPSPTLKPETVTGANVSLRWHPNTAISFSGALYFDQVKDLISRVGRAFPYENHDEAEISGFEFSGRGQWDRLDCRVSGTWQSAEFTASSQSMEEIPFVPEATAEVGIALRVGRSTHLRTDWQWVGERIFYEWGDRRELPDYSLVRLAVAHEWKNLELRIDLENALDANIEQEWGYPLSGRRLWVGFSYDFVGH
ncbi:MAG: TonB-dependent receptor, partial [Thermoanaerobaculales bacterium]|nr:TonB-dependent receptor [Thermoanaerobaculales bacterium]